jgi:hypothetical protein
MVGMRLGQFERVGGGVTSKSHVAAYSGNNGA